MRKITVSHRLCQCAQTLRQDVRITMTMCVADNSAEQDIKWLKADTT